MEFSTNLTAGSKSPPLRVIFARILWDFTWLILGRPWPRRFGNAVRIGLLRMFGAKIAPNVLVCPDVRIMKPWQLEIGTGSAIGSRVDIYNFCMVRIGAMALISQDCYICTGGHDHTDPKMPLIVRPITIGSETWIAAGVFISPGVEIGDGTVIGARSVVTKNMPGEMICAGNPCRPIKPRVRKQA